MRLSNIWSDTLYVESARRKDMIVVATGGFELFLTCLQPSKRKKWIKPSRNSFLKIQRTQKTSSNRKESLVISPCCLVSCMQSVCRHTCFASSANESLWALTLECPKDINTCAAILAWIGFTARTFVDVWEKKTQVDAWSVSLLWCIFLRGLSGNLLSGTEATVVSRQTSNRNIYRERIVFPFPVLLPSLHFRIYS